jgi:hypothetical protein
MPVIRYIFMSFPSDPVPPVELEVEIWNRQQIHEMLDACREGRVHIHADSEHMRPSPCAAASGPHANSKARRFLETASYTGAVGGGGVLNRKLTM